MRMVFRVTAGLPAGCTHPGPVDGLGGHTHPIRDTRSLALWIAAEDCPDGEQVEDADLDVLLARLPVIAAAQG
jgi:hypothetical protein